MTDDSALDVREATPEDAAPLAAVYRNAYHETRELGFPMKAESATGDEVRTWIQESSVYVATVSGEIAGGVRLGVTDPGRVKLSRLAVHENWKGEDVGTLLVDHVESVARAEGNDEIWLTTPEEHPYLADWYRRLGYEKTGPYPLDYRDYDEIVLEKRLR